MLNSSILTVYFELNVRAILVDPSWFQELKQTDVDSEWYWMFETLDMNVSQGPVFWDLFQYLAQKCFWQTSSD